ncbi:leucine-rich repeat domain-containing protein [Akkermansiaceae bacterium]|nr:leucine-rich repeat domain-containing protein [Akkermansiaceae bacterium]
MKTLQVLLALFIIALLPLQAADLSDLTYITTGERVEKVTITDCKILASGTLVIPTTINGNPVTSIGPSAFDDCINLTSITMPDSVTSIGQSAFRDCGSLTSITIPDGVTSIGDNAFYNCEGLTSITIPDSVTSIGYGAFGWCNRLTSITIPDSVVSLGDYAFGRCLQLTTISIGNGVTSIGDYAFDRCNSLTSITIGNGVTSIEREAFLGCTSLTSITFPDSVTSIGDYAFKSCRSLTSVTFQGIAPTVGIEAFSDAADGAVALLTSENLGSYKWNGLTLTDADQSDTIAQLEAQLAQVTAERDARPTQTAYDMVVTERDARPTIAEVKDARLGSVVLQSEVANQRVKIRFSIEETDDFRTWIKRDEINEITVPLEVGKRFYRFALEDE